VNELIMQMGWKEIMLRIFVAMVAILFASNSCSRVNKTLNLPDDHPAEELLEDVILDQTGIETDLSGSSEEK